MGHVRTIRSSTVILSLLAMMNIALFLAAAAINLVTAAPTDVMERGCSAVRFNGGTYYSTHMQMSSADLIAPLGKTITATIVVRARKLSVRIRAHVFPVFRIR